MKNLAKNAGLLFIALGALCVTSCTKNDDVVPTKAVETTDVKFNVTADSNGSATGKQIDRGTIPLYVDNLNITATCTGFGIPTVASENFSFNANSSSALAPALTLNGVALGNNTFNAVSTSAESNKVLAMNLMSAADWDLAKQKTMYVTCAATPVAKVITKTGNAPINLVMNTNNGRVLAKFIQEQTLADNYTVVVNAVVGGVNMEKTITASSNGMIGFEWSNEACVEGAVVNFTIRIYEKANPGTQATLLNTITKSITVQKAKNIVATYTIHNTDVITNLETGSILIQFPSIDDVIINE